jgi:hypothetical protein
MTPAVTPLRPYADTQRQAIDTRLARVEGRVSEMSHSLSRLSYGNDWLEDGPRLWLVRDCHFGQ